MFRNALRYYRLLDRRLLLLTLLGGTAVSLSVFTNSIIALLFSQIINDLTASSYRRELVTLVILVYALTWLLNLGGEVMYNFYKGQTILDLRDRMFQVLFNFDVDSIKRRGASYYTKVIADEVNSSAVLLDYSFLRNIFMLGRMVFAMWIVYRLDVVFFLIFMGSITCVVLYSRVAHKWTSPFWSRLLEEVRRANAFTTETLEKLTTILSGKMGEKRIGQNREWLQKIESINLKIGYRKVFLDAFLIDLPSYVTYTLIVLFGVQKVLDKTFRVGDLVLLWTYYSYITSPIIVLREFSRSIAQSEAIVNNIDRLLKQPELPRLHINAHADKPVLEVSDLSVVKGERTILNRVSFAVKEGMILGLVGLSGEGKSTLINTLLGMSIDHSGEVTYMGHRLSHTHISDILSSIAYCAQDVQVLNTSLEDNIVLGYPRENALLDVVLARYGIQSLTGRDLGENGAFISGGEKQRLQLARLSYQRKPFFILDEPLVGLDLISEHAILEVLTSELASKTGMVVSHKLNVMDQLTTHLLVLDSGEVESFGPTSDVMKSSPLMQRLRQEYEHQARFM